MFDERQASTVPSTVVLSPDERFLYVYSYDSSFPGITIFSRDSSTVRSRSCRAPPAA